MKRVLTFAMTLGLVALLVGAGFAAGFVDIEEALGNNFAAGTLNLEVGGKDPTQWSFGVSNMKPGDNKNFDVGIRNTGSVDGDASVEITLSNSSEGANPEPEGDTAGYGELDEQVQICLYMQEYPGKPGGFNSITCGWAHDLNGQTIDIPDDKDAWINDGTTDTRFRVRAHFRNDDNGYPFDNNDAMGDSFDLNLTFRLEQP